MSEPAIADAAPLYERSFAHAYTGLGRKIFELFEGRLGDNMFCTWPCMDATSDVERSAVSYHAMRPSGVDGSAAITGSN